jgi:hypothetical protein
MLRQYGKTSVNKCQYVSITSVTHVAEHGRTMQNLYVPPISSRSLQIPALSNVRCLTELPLPPEIEEEHCTTSNVSLVSWVDLASPNQKRKKLEKR